MIISYIIKDTVLNTVLNDNRCLIIVNNYQKKTQICQLDSLSNDFMNEWLYDFNLFKNQCFAEIPRSLNPIPDTEEKKLEDQFKERINSVKLDIVMEKLKQVQNAQTDEDSNIVTHKIQSAEEISMNAIQKEDQLEKLLEKEEVQKQNEQTEELKLQLKQEKKKNDCLLTALKEKEIEDQKNLGQIHDEEEVSRIQQDTKRKIALKRLLIKRRLEQIRLKNERERKNIKNEIMTIRFKAAEKLKQSIKAGSITPCIDNDNSKVLSYCQNNFNDNPVKLLDCKEEDKFCYMCCENEFGELHVVERDKCYSACEKKN